MKYNIFGKELHKKGVKFMGYINENKAIMVRIPTYLDLDTVYPVGSVYMSANNISPASLFGGTWTQIKGFAKLWENPNPTSALAPTTITLNESRANYKWTIIHFMAENDNYYTMRILNNGYTITSLFYAQGVSALYLKNRYMTFGSDNVTVTVDSGYSADVTGNSRVENNSVCVPIAIYGTNELGNDEIQYIWKRTA